MKTKGVNEESQRLMNARLWQCIQDNGGVQDFAKSTGLSPQTLYNIRDNRSFPSAGTLKVFTKKVPSFSIGAIFGESDSLDWRGTGIASNPTPTPPDALKAENKRLEAENKRLEADLRETKNELRAAIREAREARKDAMTVVRQSFPAFSNQTPMSRMMACGVAEEREPIGYGRSYQDLSTANLLSTQSAAHWLLPPVGY